MSLPIKLISTDFDGTIFAEFESPPIPERLVSLIGDLQARGAKWIINTGRDMSSLMEALARSQIRIQPDFLVLVEREIYHHDGVRYASVADWNAACTSEHAALFERVRPEVSSLTEWVNSRFHATVYEDPYSPFCVIAGNNGEADLIHTRMAEFCSKFSQLTVVRNDVYARFSHVAYNKGTALAEISRRLGVDPTEIFAAGDHLNDLPMLKSEFAGFLTAPRNAIPEVKEVVTRQQGFVSGLSCGNGTAEGLEYHLAVKK